ncbi:MAG: prephenate dehydrogenase [Spirochaetaceae bacterium]|jgi:prephenate dehydrogenase|nr:prephenate dehydrogenase [Spirochaetaceae bacterium]
MKQAENCTFGFAGLGLMGGAFAMALRRIISEAAPQGGTGRILAFDTNQETLNMALSAGVIDKAFLDPEAMLSQCDVVFLCLTPAAIITFMERWQGAFKPGALVTDIAGVKQPIAAWLEANLRKDIDFIPGHPMAGSEKEGFANADKCRFEGRNYILVPLPRNSAENLRFLRSLITRIGFGRIVETAAAEHDRKIAFTSQLCHVIASALIDCQDDTAITEFGGGSFEDLTRIAMINAPMWAELFTENRDDLTAQIDLFAESLQELRTMIAEGDNSPLIDRLNLVRNRRSAMASKDRR